MSNMPPGDGWRSYAHTPPIPFSGCTIELWRDGWDAPWVGKYQDIHPQMNIYGLWWRWRAKALMDAANAEREPQPAHGANVIPFRGRE